MKSHPYVLPIVLTVAAVGFVAWGARKIAEAMSKSIAKSVAASFDGAK